MPTHETTIHSYYVGNLCKRDITQVREWRWKLRAPRTEKKRRLSITMASFRRSCVKKAERDYSGPFSEMFENMTALFPFFTFTFKLCEHPTIR